MESVRQAEKKYCSGAMIVAIVIGFFFIIAGHRPVGKGLILGTIFSTINFVLIGETLPAKLGKSKNKTFFLSLGSILFRYVLLAIPIGVSIKFQEFNLIAAACGIFMVQLLILADHFFSILSPARRKQF